MTLLEPCYGNLPRLSDTEVRVLSRSCALSPGCPRKVLSTACYRQHRIVYTAPDELDYRSSSGVASRQFRQKQLCVEASLLSTYLLAPRVAIIELRESILMALDRTQAAPYVTHGAYPTRYVSSRKGKTRARDFINPDNRDLSWDGTRSQR